MKQDKILGIHQHWAVAFIDILGQRDAMRQIDFVPDQSNAEQMERFVAGIKRTYGAVTFIHNTFTNWAGAQESEKPSILGLSEDQLKVWRTMRQTPLRFQRFSDGMMIYLSLADIEQRSPVAAIFFLFGACASVLLGSLGSETPIRGGIDIGTGMVINENELYGPVMARAYALESEVAQYPRIVVGDRCVQYLKLTQNSQEAGFKAEFERRMAAVCLDLLMVDIDGFTAIDFLGAGFKQHIAFGLDPAAVSMAHKFIIQQLELHRKNRNTKLSFRYSQLLNYFEAKMGNWLGDKESVEPEN